MSRPVDVPRDQPDPRTCCPAAVSAMLMACLLAVQLFLPGCCDFEIVTDELPPGKIAQPYRFDLESECGSGFWSLSTGSLPPGISLSSEGELRGTPSVSGTFFFTVMLDNFSGEVLFKGFSLEVLG